MTVKDMTDIISFSSDVGMLFTRLQNIIASFILSEYCKNCSLLHRAYFVDCSAAAPALKNKRQSLDLTYN